MRNFSLPPEQQHGQARSCEPGRLPASGSPGRLSGRPFPSVWKGSAQLFICFYLPYKQFGLLLGKEIM